MSFRIQFDSELVKEEGRTELTDILESQRGRKCIFYEKQLEGHFVQLVPEGLNSKLLKENNVAYYKELKSEFVTEIGSGLPDCFLYFIRPNVATMKLVAQQILKNKDAGSKN